MEDNLVQNELLYLLVGIGVIGGAGLAAWLRRDKKDDKRPNKKQSDRNSSKGFR